MKLRAPQQHDWVVAVLTPLLFTIAAGMAGQFGQAAAAVASHRAAVMPDREAANVAAMATRDYFTATQDRNPLMALVHVTSASALLSAARRMSTDETLSLALNSDVRGIASDIDELQRSITAKMATRRHGRKPAQPLPA